MPISDIKVRNLKASDRPYKVSEFEGLFVLVKVSGQSRGVSSTALMERKSCWLSVIIQPSALFKPDRPETEPSHNWLRASIQVKLSKKMRIRLEAKGQTFEKNGAMFLEKQRKEGKSKAALDKTAYPMKLANSDFGRKLITEIIAPLI